ncbi:Thiol:disulfide oxidoreductase related to ResA [Serinicoccus hydrothermalis]|uniref:Thiol:disulfide oxidoreductase related to ResA n=1 Tax=Serinicoccus hydrothermalis TaxID=1758689 RepID=A0A1B1NBK7_9MICO|nr:TlpA disulfide reductase family protein [Serinicoccus hydrothermalis]ANS78817.1 Thiol:disulfide oxidoreductase related to ResA [Serinicoccus hydrothermalis]
MRAGARGVGLAAVLVLGLGACSDEGTSITEQMRQGDQKGYVAGDGTLEQLAPEERSDPVTLAGTTLEDEEWSLEQQRGEVVVVNVWGSWCGPCVAEVPELVEVETAFREAGEPVQFIGVNSRDTVPNALAFEEKYDIPYPSLQDDGGRTRAQLGSMAVATPTTLVLDGEGRLAARVSGEVDASTLTGMVEDVLGDGTVADGGGAGG